MKIRKLSVYFVIVALGFLLAQCTKEGPIGPAGPAGADGTDGTAGVDGNLACLQCHTQNHMDSLENAFEVSVHFTSNMMYTGDPVYIYAGAGESRKACAPCHTNEGFVETQTTGRDTLTAALDAPTHITCVTCHSGHESFEPQDEALRLTGGTFSAVDSTWMDLGNNGNACISCHQPRTDWSEMVISATEATITSSHAGPHHGPQSAILLGTGGSISGNSMAHKTAGCTKCHMGAFNETETTGSHTFNANNENCASCHTTPADFDFNSYISAEFDPAFATLEGKLITAGLIDATGATLPGTYPLDAYKAWWNYILLKEDRSHGVHNPTYALSLLSTSNNDLLP